MMPWTSEQKQAFADSQFALQHLHFTRHHAGADFWVVLRDGRPVGRLYLDRSAPSWRIVDIGLVPEMRGQGLGTALLEGIQAEAVAAGAEGVALTVLVENPRAHALYLRAGFVDEGEPSLHQAMTWRPA